MQVKTAGLLRDNNVDRHNQSAAANVKLEQFAARFFLEVDREDRAASAGRWNTRRRAVVQIGTTDELLS